MAIEISYLDFVEAVELHFALMKVWGETRYGVESRELIESALARPRHAAIYERADLLRQAATLCFGLTKNHPWTGGNKRTAAFLMEEFLHRNNYELTATAKEMYEMSLAVEADRCKVDEIESWLRTRVTPTKS